MGYVVGLTAGRCNDNLNFYLGLMAHYSGAYIDDIHRLWWQDLTKLEKKHNYIQWYVSVYGPFTGQDLPHSRKRVRREVAQATQAW